MATFADGPVANSTSSGSTLALTGITAAVGALLILWCTADNAGTAGAASTSSSITDAAGNTWTMERQTVNSPGGAANDGTTLTVWSCHVTSALTSATITLHFSPNTTSKTAGMQIGAPDAGCAMVLEAVGAGATASGTGRSTTATVALGTTMIGACAIETNEAITADSDTTRGSWSPALTAVANTGAVGTSQTLVIQRKTVTASGSQTYNTSTVSTRDAAINHVLVHEVVAATLAATTSRPMAAFDAVVGTVVTMAATTAPVTARFLAPTSRPRAGTKSVAILIRLDWPDDQVTRLWSGNGAFIDGDGEIWRGAGLITGLDELERAVNGEAPSITLALSGISSETSGRLWDAYRAGNLIDAQMRVLLQNCDEDDQPQGVARIVFTGYFANAIFDDSGGAQPVSAVSADIINKFSLRRTPNWSVLSDSDQKARSAVINPSASPDRFAERVASLESKTITWPRSTG